MVIKDENEDLKAEAAVITATSGMSTTDASAATPPPPEDTDASGEPAATEPTDTQRVSEDQNPSIPELAEPLSAPSPQPAPTASAASAAPTPPAPTAPATTRSTTASHQEITLDARHAATRNETREAIERGEGPATMRDMDDRDYTRVMQNHSIVEDKSRRETRGDTSRISIEASDKLLSELQAELRTQDASAPTAAGTDDGVTAPPSGSATTPDPPNAPPTVAEAPAAPSSPPEPNKLEPSTSTETTETSTNPPTTPPKPSVTDQIAKGAGQGPRATRSAVEASFGDNKNAVAASKQINDKDLATVAGMAAQLEQGKELDADQIGEMQAKAAKGDVSSFRALELATAMEKETLGDQAPDRSEELKAVQTKFKGAADLSKKVATAAARSETLIGRVDPNNARHAVAEGMRAMYTDKDKGAAAAKAVRDINDDDIKTVAGIATDMVAGKAADPEQMAKLKERAAQGDESAKRSLQVVNNMQKGAEVAGREPKATDAAKSTTAKRSDTKSGKPEPALSYWEQHDKNARDIASGKADTDKLSPGEQYDASVRAKAEGKESGVSEKAATPNRVKVPGIAGGVEGTLGAGGIDSQGRMNMDFTQQQSNNSQAIAALESTLQQVLEIVGLIWKEIEG
jgi:hypothetical protein